MGFEFESGEIRTLTKMQKRAADGVLVIASVEETCEKMGHVRVSVATPDAIDPGGGESAIEHNLK